MQDRWSRFRPPIWVQDTLLALFIAAAQVQGTMVRIGAPDVVVLRPLADSAGLGYVLLIASGLVLIVRRRYPVAIFLGTAVASLIYYALDFPDGPGWLGLYIATYTLTERGDGRRTVGIAAVGIATLAAVWLISARDVQPPAAIGWVFFRIGAAIMSAALGESVRTRRRIAFDAVRRAEQAERTREDEARARVNEERLRIAREVHDTVAHSIAVINIQSGVAAHVIDKRPSDAREALRSIEQTSSRALEEMRAILGVLRGDERRTPQPGIDQLDELTASAKDAGVDVDVVRQLPPVMVPTVVDSAAYRIMQESITNAIRHVGPTLVRVVLDCPNGDLLRIQVSDVGPRPGVSGGSGDRRADRRDGSGRGIAGMRERCELLGGELDAGPLPDGGFIVTARLPLAAGRAVEA